MHSGWSWLEGLVSGLSGAQHTHCCQDLYQVAIKPFLGLDNVSWPIVELRGTGGYIPGHGGGGQWKPPSSPEHRLWTGREISPFGMLKTQSFIPPCGSRWGGWGGEGENSEQEKYLEVRMFEQRRATPV